jgi:hypothetical protein
VSRLILVAAIVTCAAACSSGATSNGNPGGDGAAGGTGGDAGFTTDVGAPDGCLRIRACAADCADDACIQSCLAAGTSAAQALYLQLRECTRTACPDPQDETCRCEAECVFPGPCTDLQDMCSEGVDDSICVRCF